MERIDRVVAHPITVQDEVDDDDESSDDEDAHLKKLRPAQHSIRRNDSFTSFLSRSERNIILGKDKPPPSSEASKRRIQFRDALEDVKEIEKIQDEFKEHYWMTDTDFDRIETDVKMTQFRWQNSKTGKIPFDEVNNSIRGLENVIRDEKSNVDMTLYNHRRSVLHEIHRQKSIHGKVVEWEKVRVASEKYSLKSISLASEMGTQDELEHKKACGVVIMGAITNQGSVTRKEDTKGKGNPMFFWKKK
jgi:hypothetical protein